MVDISRWNKPHPVKLHLILCACDPFVCVSRSYDLFDDVLLMAEGSIIFHGPREQVVPFFESCGFRCPERKGVPDFLQEVTSKKDQVRHRLFRFFGVRVCLRT